MRRVLAPVAGLGLLCAASLTVLAQDQPVDRQFGEVVEATTVTVSVRATDVAGRPVTDLAAPELAVVEAGVPRQVVGVARWREPPLAPSTAEGEAAAAAVDGEQPIGDATWSRAAIPDGQVVIYVDQVLSSRYGLERSLEHLALQSERLVGLGQVEVVTADPSAELQLSTRDPRALAALLDRLARKAAGHEAHVKIRKQFVRDVEQDDLGDLFGQLSGSHGGGGSRPERPSQPGTPGSPGGGGVGTQRPIEPRAEARFRDPSIRASRGRMLALAAARQEAALLNHQRLQLSEWIASSERGGPAALFLVSDGFDTDPRDFYLASFQDNSVVAELSSDLRTLDCGPNVDELATTLAGAGWVVYPIALGDLESSQVADASTSGRGRSKSFSRDNRVFGSLSSFALRHPMEPLATVSDTTGGSLVVAADQIGSEIDALSDRLLITYQVDRAPDGRVRPISITTSRPGVSLTAPRVASALAPDAISAARTRRLLAGSTEAGTLVVEAALSLPGRDGEAMTGQVTLDVDLEGLHGLPPELLGRAAFRVTLGIVLPDGRIFVTNQYPPARDLSRAGQWQYSIPLKVPAGTTTVAVLVDEVATGAWGGIVARINGLPDVRSGSGEST